MINFFYLLPVVIFQLKFFLASEVSQNYIQGIVETMKTLVISVNNLSASTASFVDGSKRNIIYQNISKDWNLLDDSVFAVRFSFLLAELESSQWLNWAFSSHLSKTHRASLFRVPNLIVCLHPRRATTGKLSQYLIP